MSTLKALDEARLAACRSCPCSTPEETAAAAAAAAPASRVAQAADPRGGRDVLHQGPDRRAGPGDDLRERPLPESLGVLDPPDGDVHDPGRGLHPPLRLLCGQAGPSRARRASTSPTAWPRPAPGSACRHVVITSVTRDDLADGGAEHFRRCVLAVRARTGATIEVLTPDFDGDTDAIDCVLVGRARGLQPQPRDRRPPPAARPPQEPVRREPQGPRARQAQPARTCGPRAA